MGNHASVCVEQACVWFIRQMQAMDVDDEGTGVCRCEQTTEIDSRLDYPKSADWREMASEG